MTEGNVNGHPSDALTVEEGLVNNPTENNPDDSGTSPDDGETQSTYGNKTPDVSELANLVAKLNKQLADKDSYISRQSEEIKSISSSMSELKGQIQGINQFKPKNDDLEWEEKVYSNVPQAIKEIRESLRKEFQEELTKKEQNLLDWISKRDVYKDSWINFYDQNEHLKPFKDDVIPAITSRLKPELDRLTLNQAFERIKEESDKEIVKLRKKFSVPDGGFQNGAIKVTKSFSPLSTEKPSKLETLKDLGDEIIAAHQDIINKAKGRSSIKTQ
ncbi:MAG TPA: hypothetical protein ACFYEK_10955 [Candidatus Wunengus sp. YC60]|uniref:hypothetical protein n=1 Tax=Candidatus Wunengus sp. YC60 TaxID=3367697 RepID=UPI0040281CAE